MNTRHTNEILRRLERVDDIGCVEIRNSELLRWYDRDRVTKNVWRDIEDKWREIADDVPLLVGLSDDLWVFVYGSGLTVSTDPSDQWLKDITTYSARTLVGQDTTE